MYTLKYLSPSSFLSIYMRTRPMCAPWRTASCSYTKASQRTRSQYWWVFFGQGHCVGLFMMPADNQPLIMFLFSSLLNWRRLWSSWRASLIISPHTPTFCKRFFPTSWKGQRCVCVRACVCVVEKSSGVHCIDGYLLLSAWKKSAKHLFVLLPLLQKTRSCRVTWRE